MNESFEKTRQECPHCIECMRSRNANKHHHDITEEAASDILASLPVIRYGLLFLIGLQIGDLLTKFL